MLKAFLGNTSVNTFQRLRNNKESGVLRAVPSCAELCRVVPSPAAVVARQRCGKHISAAANQHATVEQAVFSACPALTTHGNSR
jgi:hypothetical protein